MVEARGGVGGGPAVAQRTVLLDRRPAVVSDLGQGVADIREIEVTGPERAEDASGDGILEGPTPSDAVEADVLEMHVPHPISVLPRQRGRVDAGVGAVPGVEAQPDASIEIGHEPVDLVGELDVGARVRVERRCEPALEGDVRGALDGLDHSPPSTGIEPRSTGVVACGAGALIDESLDQHDRSPPCVSEERARAAGELEDLLASPSIVEGLHDEAGRQLERRSGERGAEPRRAVRQIAERTKVDPVEAGRGDLGQDDTPGRVRGVVRGLDTPAARSRRCSELHRRQDPGAPLQRSSTRQKWHLVGAGCPLVASPPMSSSAIRQRLRNREPLLGTVVTSADPMLAEIVAGRFDLVWIDLEHSPLDVTDVARLAIALHAASCPAFVRLPCPSFERLGAVLDVGIDGVVLPRVESVAETRDATARLRYPPEGTRGSAARRASGYGNPSSAASDLACLAQIESRAATAIAPAIAHVEGIDGLVVGTADLALDLGVAADLELPAMRSALNAVRAAAHDAGVAFGVAAGGDPDAIASAADAPPDLTIYSADVRIFAQAIDDVAARTRTARGRDRVSSYSSSTHRL